MPDAVHAACFFEASAASHSNGCQSCLASHYKILQVVAARFADALVVLPSLIVHCCHCSGQQGAQQLALLNFLNASVLEPCAGHKNSILLASEQSDKIAQSEVDA